MSVTLQATKREHTKHSQVTELRGRGMVPAVVYGYGTENQSIAVSEKELLKLLRDHGRNAVIRLGLQEKPVDVVVSDYQMDALKATLVHVDFRAINLSEALEVQVPIHPVGDAKGVKEGGTLSQPIFELSIKAKPEAIPEAIELDVSDLEIGESLTVADIRPRYSFEIVSEDDFVLATIDRPRSDAELEELETTPEAADEAQPAPAGAESKAEGNA